MTPLDRVTLLITGLLAGCQVVNGVDGLVAIDHPLRHRRQNGRHGAAAVHGISGLTIAGLPIVVSLRGDTRPPQILVGVGGRALALVSQGRETHPLMRIDPDAATGLAVADDSGLCRPDSRRGES